MNSNGSQNQDWNPFSAEVAADELSTYDDMRERCPVAYSAPFGWTLFRYADIERVLEDPHHFSNRVSRHLSVPNGMDPPAHTAYRQLIEPYFSPEQVAALEPDCRAIAAELMGGLRDHAGTGFIDRFARPFAARAQWAFLGWPVRLAELLSRWTIRNQQATRTRDRQALAAIAEEFADYVREMLATRRARQPGASNSDVTARLMAEYVQNRPLSDKEIISILRNWTVGEVGTLSAAIGILVHFLATHPEHQQHLRAHPSLIPAFCEEILRLHGPLVANRRLAARPVTLGGRRIEAGEMLQLNWIAANRDPRVFPQPAEYKPDRDLSASLLWGKGIHVCPGAPLARMEMRVALETLFAETRQIELDPERTPVPACYPASGFETLPLHFS